MPLIHKLIILLSWFFLFSELAKISFQRGESICSDSQTQIFNSSSVSKKTILILVAVHTNSVFESACAVFQLYSYVNVYYMNLFYHCVAFSCLRMFKIA